MMEEMILRDDEAELGSTSCKVIGLIRELLVGGFKYFLFSSLFGEMIQFDEHIFQMG